MCKFFISMVSGMIILIGIIIIALRKHYRKVIKTKEYDIVHHIHLQDRLSKELEYINVEKKVMEKMLESKFDNLLIVKQK